MDIENDHVFKVGPKNRMTFTMEFHRNFHSLFLGLTDGMRMLFPKQKE